MALRQVGNFVARGADHVDPMLIKILEEAARRAGLDVEAYSGYRPGDRRAHGRGKATDVRIIQDGKALPNYQDPTSFRQYEQFAQQARAVQQELYPQLGQQFRWGGYFSGPKRKYGAMDTMHFDLAGNPSLGMAGGSWEGGLTDAQKRLFPGVQSAGMGGSPAFVPPDGPKGQEAYAPPAAPAAAVADRPPQSPLGAMMAGFASGFGGMGGGGPQAADAGQPRVLQDGGFGATMAAQQGADQAKQLAFGLSPDIEKMLALAPKPFARKGAALVG